LVDKVHTVLDFYDGPRGGVADFQSTPHAYEALWDPEADDFSDYWHLQPISPATFILVMEDWQIWRRWEQAYRAGETSQSTTLPCQKTKPEIKN